MDSLVLSAQSGNTDAFAALYVAHKPRVMSLCFKMTGDHDKAEDLTQDTFLQLHRKIHTFRGASQFTTWLHRMTVNVVRMEHRKNHSKARLAITLVPLMLGDDGDETVYDVPDPRPANPILRMDLTKAISTLPRMQRRATIKFYIEGREHKEINRRVTSTSKGRVHKARKKLMKYLTTK